MLTGYEKSVTPYIISGINKQTIRDLKNFAKNGACSSGNLVEVMSCEGGCVGGHSTFCMPANAVKQIKAYSDAGKDIDINE